MEDEKEIGMYDVKQEAPLTGGEKVKRGGKKFFSNSFAILQTAVFIGAILVILYIVLITPHQVDGLSMDPTFKDQEYLIANKIIYKLSSPKRGDVVIFRFSDTRDFIKRVIALPGDSVMVKEGGYIVNGEALDEYDYLDPAVFTNDGAFMHDGELLIIPDGQVFVSGDNRPYSSDSRAFGPIDISQIKGKVWFVMYPPGNFRMIGSPDYNQ